MSALALRLALAIPAIAISMSASALAVEEAGRALFTVKWVSHDRRSAGGDGLGPMHNATSCAACHHQAGPGGGGTRDHNVDLLSVIPIKDMKDVGARKQFIDKLVKLHPGFKLGDTGARPNIVLHRFGPEADYFEFRAKLLGIEEPRPDLDPARRAVLAASLAKRQAKDRSHVKTLPPVDGIHFQLSQRNTPALWGLGIVDSISGTAIEEQAKFQEREFPDVAGRAPRATGGGVGKFGWRAQTASLREFVLGACANELGLQTKNNRQAMNPLSPNYKPDQLDMMDQDVEALARFVAELPRPIQLGANSSAQAAIVRKGEQAFDRIGCAACHPRQMGKVDGLFSDLLLHDMGEGLEDPVEPNPPVVQGEQPVAGYYGSGNLFVETKVADPHLARRWRTPPLWGVKDSAPYLHDGRAETIPAAIEMHGGQGATSAGKYRNLSNTDRGHLLAFLATLAAPPRQ